MFGAISILAALYQKRGAAKAADKSGADIRIGPVRELPLPRRPAQWSNSR